LRVVFGLDTDGLEAGAGDSERRRIVAARDALVFDQDLGLEAAEDPSTAPPLILSFSGSGKIAPSSRWEAALRITTWVSLSLVMG
jgi:hypothetical protein